MWAVRFQDQPLKGIVKPRDLSLCLLNPVRMSWKALEAEGTRLSGFRGPSGNPCRDRFGKERKGSNPAPAVKHGGRGEGCPFGVFSNGVQVINEPAGGVKNNFNKASGSSPACPGLFRPEEVQCPEQCRWRIERIVVKKGEFYALENQGLSRAPHRGRPCP